MRKYGELTLCDSFEADRICGEMASRLARISLSMGLDDEDEELFWRVLASGYLNHGSIPLDVAKVLSEQSLRSPLLYNLSVEIVLGKGRFLSRRKKMNVVVLRDEGFIPVAEAQRLALSFTASKVKKVSVKVTPLKRLNEIILES